MKRLIAVWSLCMLAALASFGALLLEDRTLGLPLPYSLPLAFGATAVFGPLLLMAAAKIWPVRPIVVRAPAPVVVAALPGSADASRRSTVAAPFAHIRRPVRAAEGVILFDMASVEAARAHAA